MWRLLQNSRSSQMLRGLHTHMIQCIRRSTHVSRYALSPHTTHTHTHTHIHTRRPYASSHSQHTNTTKTTKQKGFAVFFTQPHTHTQTQTQTYTPPTQEQLHNCFIIKKELPLPSQEEMAPGEVLVQLEMASICGSDLHTISGMRHTETPIVLGHEGVGNVVRIGRDNNTNTNSNNNNNNNNNTNTNRDDVQIGDRVTWSIADSCGTCLPCAHYRVPQKCTSLFKLVFI